MHLLVRQWSELAVFVQLIHYVHFFDKAMLMIFEQLWSFTGWLFYSGWLCFLKKKIAIYRLNLLRKLEIRMKIAGSSSKEYTQN